jgi:hypothetical protein
MLVPTGWTSRAPHGFRCRRQAGSVYHPRMARRTPSVATGMNSGASFRFAVGRLSAVCALGIGLAATCRPCNRSLGVDRHNASDSVHDPAHHPAHRRQFAGGEPRRARCRPAPAGDGQARSPWRALRLRVRLRGRATANRDRIRRENRCAVQETSRDGTVPIRAQRLPARRRTRLRRRRDRNHMGDRGGVRQESAAGTVQVELASPCARRPQMRPGESGSIGHPRVAPATFSEKRRSRRCRCR